jgi:hypothetical protein
VFQKYQRHKHVVLAMGSVSVSSLITTIYDHDQVLSTGNKIFFDIKNCCNSHVEAKKKRQQNRQKTKNPTHKTVIRTKREINEYYLPKVR